MIRRAFVAAVLTACSSGSYTEANGAESGPCYANGTCNAGLVCASNRCVRIDPAPDDGGDVVDSGAAETGETGAGDASDSGAGDAGCASPQSPPELRCGSATCGTDQTCCLNGPQCQASGASCTGVEIECLSPNQCNGTERCCALAVTMPGSTCPVVLTAIQKTVCRAGTCNGTEATLCYASGSAACASGQTCVAAVLEGSPGGNTKVGLCR